MTQLGPQAPVGALQIREVVVSDRREHRQGDEQVPLPLLPGAIGDQLLEEQAGRARQGHPGSLDLDRGAGRYEGQGAEHEKRQVVVFQDIGLSRILGRVHSHEVELQQLGGTRRPHRGLVGGRLERAELREAGLQGRVAVDGHPDVKILGHDEGRGSTGLEEVGDLGPDNQDARRLESRAGRSDRGDQPIAKGHEEQYRDPWGTGPQQTGRLGSGLTGGDFVAGLVGAYAVSPELVKPNNE